jgi:dynamin 1/3
MKIVNKTQRDLVPKTIMYMIVNEVKQFLKAELLPSLYQAGDPSLLMEESVEETQKREETLRMYDAIKEALGIISEVSASTVSTPLPPPVNDEWLQVDESRNIGQPPSSPGGFRRGPAPIQSGGGAAAGAGMNRPAPNIPSRPAPSRPGGIAAPAAPGNSANQSATLPAPLVPQRPGGTTPTGNRPSVPARPN